MSTRMLSPALALIAVAALLWAALAVAPPPSVDLGAPGDSRSIGGFYDAEVGGGASFRWSGPDARLVLHGAPPGAALLSLRLSGERLVAQGIPGLALARGEQTFAAFEVSPGWRAYRVLLPPGAAVDAAGAALPIDLRTAVSRPGADEDGRDYRALGAPVDWVRLTPLAGEPSGALARAIGLVWAVALAGVLAWRLARGGALAWRRARWRAAPLWASGVILGLGLALAAWAWRDPGGLAWALPPLPWALGAASVLLLVHAGGNGGRFVTTKLTKLTKAGSLAPVPTSPPGPPSAAERGRRMPKASPKGAQPGGGAVWIAAGLLGLGAGVGLMHSQLAVLAGVGLAVAGLLALTGAPGGLGAGVWERPAREVGRRAALLALGGVFLLALALRLFRLDQLPFGLWRDEARHGLVALRIAEDPAYRPVYVLDLKVHLPGLGLYPFAAALRLFGVHLWTLRAVTAMAGALTVLPLYAVAARLSGRRAVGLVAALLLAASSWHLSVSRLAFPTVLEPLLSLSAWALILVAVAPPSPAQGAADRGMAGRWRLLAALCAGVLLGAAAQTYHTGRVTPLAAAWLCLLLLGLDRRAWRPWLARVGAMALGFALTVAPLAAYALAHAGDFNDRVGDVFLLGEAALRGRAPLTALDANLGRHLLMFTAEGDANGRHHAPLRPLLDILTGAGLLLGLAALLRSAGDWRSRFLLGALAIGLLPGLLAVDAPHAMRTFGAVAPACLIAALGWAEALRLALAPAPTSPPGPRSAAERGSRARQGGRFFTTKLTKLAKAGPLAGTLRAYQARRQRPSQDVRQRGAGWAAPSSALRGALVAAAVAAVGLNAWLYFGVMPADPQVFAGFYPVQSQMGVYVRERAGGELVFVPREVRDHPSFAFLAAGLPVAAFDTEAGPGQGRAEAPPAPGATFLLSGYFPEQEAAAMAPFLGPGATPDAAGAPFPDGRGPTFYVYRARKSSGRASFTTKLTKSTKAGEALPNAESSWASWASW